MTEEKQDKQQSKKRQIVVYACTAFFTLGLIIGVCWWIIDIHHYRRTNDCYVHGNQIPITPLIDGFLTSVRTDDTYLVEKNQILFTQDETNSIIALNEAKKNLANAVRNVCQIYHEAFANESDILVKKAEYLRAREFYNHRLEVVEQGAVAFEDFQYYQTQMEATENAYEQAKSAFFEKVALIQGVSIRENPTVIRAAEQVIQAWVNLYRCKTYAPVRGLVAQRVAQVGTWVKAGDPLLSIIPLDQIWVNANFKETQMKRMKIGQPVKVWADMYGPNVVYHGVIVGLPGGAGNAFTILPPQNLSGNWIKIVQRLPVRVVIDPQDLVKYPLRLGMTCHARVNIRNQSDSYFQTPEEVAPSYYTDIYKQETYGSWDLVDSIFQANLDPSLAVYENEPFYSQIYEE